MNSETKVELSQIQKGQRVRVTKLEETAAPFQVFSQLTGFLASCQIGENRHTVKTGTVVGLCDLSQVSTLYVVKNERGRHAVFTNGELELVPDT